MMSDSLEAALERHRIALPAGCIGPLNQYCQLLWDWNTRLNLTRHTDFEAFVTRDLVDTQQLSAQLGDTETVLDIGAGGGVPGIVLALLRPDLRLTLAESTSRKARALEAMVQDLQLDLPVLDERGEDVLRRLQFDTLTARAVAPLKKLLQWLRPVRQSVGRLLLIKGPAWQQEQVDAKAAGLLRGATLNVLSEYATVGRDGNSVVLEVRWQR